MSLVGWLSQFLTALLQYSPVLLSQFFVLLYLVVAVLHLEFGASEKCLVVNREKDVGLSEAEGQ